MGSYRCVSFGGLGVFVVVWGWFWCFGVMDRMDRGCHKFISESESELITGDTSKDNHSPAPVVRGVSP